jgi:predicted ATPase/DNA-binding SARP family transcriptional activator
VGAARFGILGTLQVVVDGAAVPIEALQLRRLVACLLLAPGRPVANRDLVECLWPDVDGAARPRDPDATLRVYASRLRTMLPPGVGLPRDVRGYRLEVERDDVDAGCFEQLLASATAGAPGDPATAAGRLREALSLWRGGALSEFRDEPWALGAAVRLDELRVVALERLNDARLALGEHGELCGELERHVDEHPLRERLWGQLMLALYRSGRQADALRAYQRLRERLVDELGIEPSRELAELESAVLRHDRSLDLVLPAGTGPSAGASPAGHPEGPEPAAPPLGPDAEARLRQPLQRPQQLHNLPAQVTSFVGRERETAEVRGGLEETRLLTLTGPGGSGKTRLALEVAGRRAEEDAAAVWLVELAALTEAAEVEPSVAAVLGVKAPAGVALGEALGEALRGEEMLLVLDNCEHLVGACATLVDTLLRSCPGIRTLATSREPLGVEGEVVYRVPSLGVPSSSTYDPAAIAREDSVRLFVERARLQQPAFVLDASSAPRVASLCRRLDGIPLALELAAARLRVLSLAQVHDRLDERFRLLVGGARTRLPRQQTLEALIDWSYDLLARHEQVALRHLAVFTGSFDFDAAEAVLEASGGQAWGALDQLSSLVDKSLVVAETTGEASRYRLLETIRQYALDKLASEEGEAALEKLRAAHASYYLGLVERAAPALSTAGQFDWLDRLDLEFDNVRVALGYLVAAEETAPAAMSMVVGLGRFVEWRGHESELFAATETLDERSEPGAGSALAVQVGLVYARLLGQTDPGRAITRLESLLTKARQLEDQALIGEVLGRLSWLQWSTGDYVGSALSHQQALEVARRSNAYLPLLLVLNGPAASREERLDALRMATAAGDEIGRYLVLCSLGASALDEGDVAAARTYFQEALPIIERPRPGARSEVVAAPEMDQLVLVTGETQVTSLMPSLLVNLGTALVLDGEVERARPIYRRALDAARRHLDDRQAGYGLFGLALCEARSGDAVLAAMLHGAAEQQLERAGFALEEAERRLAADDAAALSSVLGQPAFEAAWARGRGLVKDVAMDLALGRTGTGAGTGSRALGVSTAES